LRNFSGICRRAVTRARRSLVTSLLVSLAAIINAPLLGKILIVGIIVGLVLWAISALLAKAGKTIPVWVWIVLAAALGIWLIGWLFGSWPGPVN
jgi:hypothetical protein